MDDEASLEKAGDAMHRLRNDLGSDRPIILVANKIDLVRNRKVRPEGRFNKKHIIRDATGKSPKNGGSLFNIM